MKEHLKKLLNKYLRQKSSIKYDELRYLNELLKTDLPIKTCLLLIKDKRNSKAIDEVIQRLNEGYLIENIISDYLPKDISLYMINLLRFLPFSKSLDLALKYSDKSKENISYLTKSIAYPLGLLFVSITGLYLFDVLGLDSIMNLMKSFTINFNTINILRILLKVLIRLFYFLLLIICLLVLYFKSDKRIAFAYIAMCKYFPISFVKIYFTEEFMSLFILTSSLGYKTKEIVEILKSLKNKPIISLLAFHMDERLLEGDSLKNASNIEYLDDDLSKFISISIYSKNFLGILNNYVELSKMKIQTKAKLYTTIIQSISYAFIGFVIIFVYQVLFLPMQAINGF